MLSAGVVSDVQGLQHLGPGCCASQTGALSRAGRSSSSGMAAMLSAENMRRASHCLCSSGSSCTAPSRRAIASSLAKMPTSRVRPLMVRFAERGEKQKLDDDDSTSRQAHGKGPRPTRGPAPRDLDARGPMDRKIRSIAPQAVYPCGRRSWSRYSVRSTAPVGCLGAWFVWSSWHSNQGNGPAQPPSRPVATPEGATHLGWPPQPARQRQHKAEAAAKSRSGGRCRGEAAQAPPCRANAAED